MTSLGNYQRCMKSSVIAGNFESYVYAWNLGFLFLFSFKDWCSSGNKAGAVFFPS